MPIQTRRRTMSASRYALAQRPQIVLCRHAGHCAIGRRRGKQHGCLVLGNRCQQRLRRGSFEQQRRRTDAQGKEQQAAQPEGEGEGRAADEEIIGRRAQDRPRQIHPNRLSVLGPQREIHGRD